MFGYIVYYILYCISFRLFFFVCCSVLGCQYQHKPVVFMRMLDPPPVVTHDCRRRRFRIDTEVRCVGAHPPFWPLEPARVKPN